MRSYYKTYVKDSLDGKYKLESWMQRRCEVCGRYIGGKKHFLCERCYKKRSKEQIRISYIERRGSVRYYSIKTLRELINIPIPAYLRDSLRNYT